MSGYIQRLLERSASVSAGEAAAPDLAAPHAQSAAPVRSPLADADQRLRIADFDGDLLASILLEDTAPQNNPWLPPEVPFSTPRDRQDPQTQVTPAPTMAPELTLAPAPPFAQTPFSETSSTAAPKSEDGKESLTRKRPQTEAPRHDAEPAFSPSEDSGTSINERIAERNEPRLRESSETRYLFLRNSGFENKPRANPQSRYVVEPQKQFETFRDTVSPAQPLAMTKGEAPTVDAEHAPSHREVRAEPALAHQEPGPSSVDTSAASTTALPNARSSTGRPQKQQELKTPEVHRGSDEAVRVNEPLSIWSSASAASVIGPLPTRPVSLTIRGCRRR